MKSKLLRFEYFLLNEMVDDRTTNTVTPTTVSLEPVLVRLQGMDIMRRRITRNDEAIVLMGIEKLSRRIGRRNYDYWKLLFVRIREDLLPSIVDSNGLCRDVPLNNDENVGEFTNILYDNNNGVILIQRKQEGILPRYIADFFGEFNSTIMHAIPILSPNDLRQFRNGTIIRNLNFSAASCIESTDPSVSAVANAALQTGARFFDMSLRTGIVGRSEGLSLTGILRIARSLFHNPDVTALKIKARLPEDSKVESYDLFEQRCEERETFRFERTDNNVRVNNIIFDSIERAYFRRLRDINTYIGR